MSGELDKRPRAIKESNEAYIDPRCNKESRMVKKYYIEQVQDYLVYFQLHLLRFQQRWTLQVHGLVSF